MTDIIAPTCSDLDEDGGYDHESLLSEHRLALLAIGHEIDCYGPVSPEADQPSAWLRYAGAIASAAKRLAASARPLDTLADARIEHDRLREALRVVTEERDRQAADVLDICDLRDRLIGERDRLAVDLGHAQRFLAAEQAQTATMGARNQELSDALGIKHPGYCDDSVWGGGVLEMVNALQGERDRLAAHAGSQSSILRAVAREIGCPVSTDAQVEASILAAAKAIAERVAEREVLPVLTRAMLDDAYSTACQSATTAGALIDGTMAALGKVALPALDVDRLARSLFYAATEERMGDEPHFSRCARSSDLTESRMAADVLAEHYARLSPSTLPTEAAPSDGDGFVPIAPSEMDALAAFDAGYATQPTWAPESNKRSAGIRAVRKLLGGAGERDRIAARVAELETRPVLTRAMLDDAYSTACQSATTAGALIDGTMAALGKVALPALDVDRLARSLFYAATEERMGDEPHFSRCARSSDLTESRMAADVLAEHYARLAPSATGGGGAAWSVAREALDIAGRLDRQLRAAGAEDVDADGEIADLLARLYPEPAPSQRPHAASGAQAGRAEPTPVDVRQLAEALLGVVPNAFEFVTADDANNIALAAWRLGARPLAAITRDEGEATDARELEHEAERAGFCVDTREDEYQEARCPVDPRCEKGAIASYSGSYNCSCPAGRARHPATRDAAAPAREAPDDLAFRCYRALHADMDSRWDYLDADDRAAWGRVAAVKVEAAPAREAGVMTVGAALRERDAIAEFHDGKYWRQARRPAQPGCGLDAERRTWYVDSTKPAGGYWTTWARNGVQFSDLVFAVRLVPLASADTPPDSRGPIGGTIAGADMRDATIDALLAATAPRKGT